MSRRVKIILAVVAFCSLPVQRSSSGCSRGSGPVSRPPRSPRPDLGVTVSASGKVAAGDRAEVYPPAAGTLDDVYVKDGQTVTAGQKLAKMDTGPLRAGRQAGPGRAVRRRREAGARRLSTSRRRHAPTSTCGREPASTAGRQAQYDNAKIRRTTTPSMPPAPSPSQDHGDAVGARVRQASKLGHAPRLLSAEGDASLKVEKGRRRLPSSEKSADAADRRGPGALDRQRSSNLDNATLIAPIDGTVFLNPVGAAGR